MKISAFKSTMVRKDNGILLIHIGFLRYDLGIQIHDWPGVRFMLIWWHVVIYSEKV